MLQNYKPGDPAPTGTSLSCKGWQQEAAYRMLMNNLDRNVAEDPDELVVYGGTGKAARNHKCLYKILELLTTLENDETLLVQSGKPVAVFPSTPMSPRVVISNSVLVPKWATWEHYRSLEEKGLMMYGQMTAGSWIYIGSQGILQGTYETFLAAAQKHFQSDLSGRLVLSGGLGGMGGAQPLAATMAGGVFLGIDVDRGRIEKRLQSGYLDVCAENLDKALALCQQAMSENRPLSVAVVGNAAEVFADILNKGIVPDLVTDQTSAHDPLNGYVPMEMTLDEAIALRKNDPDRYVNQSLATMAHHVESMVIFQKKGAHVFDYGNNLRAGAVDGGYKEAFCFPGFVPAYIRPLFCDGKGPFRWVALSGDPEDIYATDRALAELFDDKGLHNWLKKAGEQVQFQGLPARICWLGYGDRVKAGLCFNRLVREGIVKAPIVIGRDHLDCGSVASPNRETEDMMDGSDAVGDWALLNFAMNAIGGASWTSFHHGGGVGMGYSLHAGMVALADGTEDADQRLTRVLTSDPGLGIARHADAGYERALTNAREMGVKIPFVTV